MKKLFKAKCGYKVVALSIGEATNIFPTSPLIDDMNGISIPLQSSECFYIPVLNHLVSKKSFLEWDSRAKLHSSDLKYEDRKIEFYFKDLKLEDYYPDVEA